ncbi:thiamine pyrophosphate-binding protein [Glutamicibacter uratoxydans]|uniref:thiamine pyrophosphate-binding protein n=1 Tax=Glutamicibacter uratoxydans TaxID=43667 RepID=UPI003D6F1F9F
MVEVAQLSSPNQNIASEQAETPNTVVLEALGAALPELGVSFMAGLPGSGNYELVHAAREAGVRYYGSNHEAGAVGVADGWSRTTGQVGVAMLSQGPGLTNGLTALTEAVKSRTSMVVIVIDTPRTSRHGNLNVDQTAVCRALGAGVEVVRSAASAVDDLARSLHRTQTEMLPIVLMVPLDLVHAKVPKAQTTVRSLAYAAPPWPDLHSVKEAANKIKLAKRPVILAGRGAMRSEAGAELRALAEQIGAVLTVAAPAKGLFSGDDFDLGIAGSFASPVTAELLGQADLVLAFGASLNAWTTGNGRMLGANVPAIQVDVDPSAIGSHRSVDMAIHGDAAVTATQIYQELVRGEWKQTGYRTPELKNRLATNDPSSHFIAATGEKGLDPRVFTLALESLLPAERTLTVDSGHFMGWPAKYLSVPDAAGFVYPQSFQSVGLGLAVSIGVGIARPDRISVLTIGDGGWMLSPQELDTAVQNEVSLLAIVYNDSSYGAEVHRFEPLGLNVDLVRFPERNFEAMAQSVGAQGVTVRSLDDLEKLKPWLENPSGPMLVDAKIDPTVIGDWIAGNSKAALA